MPTGTDGYGSSCISTKLCSSRFLTGKRAYWCFTQTTYRGLQHFIALYFSVRVSLCAWWLFSCFFNSTLNQGLSIRVEFVGGKQTDEFAVTHSHESSNPLTHIIIYVHEISTMHSLLAAPSAALQSNNLACRVFYNSPVQCNTSHPICCVAVEQRRRASGCKKR